MIKENFLLWKTVEPQGTFLSGRLFFNCIQTAFWVFLKGIDCEQNGSYSFLYVRRTGRPPLKFWSFLSDWFVCLGEPRWKIRVFLPEHRTSFRELCYMLRRDVVISIERKWIQITWSRETRPEWQESCALQTSDLFGLRAFGNKDQVCGTCMSVYSGIPGRRAKLRISTVWCPLATLNEHMIAEA